MARTKAQISLDSARRMLHHGAFGRVANLLSPLHDAEVAEFLARIPLSDRRRLVSHLDGEQLRRILGEMPGEVIAETLEVQEDGFLETVLTGLEQAHAADVLRALPEDRRERLLASLAEETAHAFGRLLAYPDGSIGSIMTPDPFALNESLSVSEAVDSIRRIGEEMPLYAYVVDDRRHLVGVLSFRQLLIASSMRKLREIMTPDPISTGPEEHQEEAARLVSRYDFVALPVVDDANRLLGVVAVDDVVDMLQSEATEEMYKMAGLGSGDRVFSPVLRSVAKRLPWLTVSLGTATIAAGVVAAFQTTIQQAVVLAVFMPIGAIIGGNAATQSVTVVIRGLALGELAVGEGLRAVGKEGATCLLLGTLLGTLSGVLAWAYAGDPVLAGVLVVAMILNLLIAGLVGSAVPVLLKTARIDPALASSVIVTAFTDFFGFGLFLGLATLALRIVGI